MIPPLTTPSAKPPIAARRQRWILNMLVIAVIVLPPCVVCAAGSDAGHGHTMHGAGVKDIRRNAELAAVGRR